MRRLLIAMLLLTLVGFAALAQPVEQLPDGPAVPAQPNVAPVQPSPQPAVPAARPAPPTAQDEVPLRGRRILVNFRAMDIDHVLDMIGQASGLTIVRDPTLTGATLTVITPGSVDLEDALDIIRTALGSMPVPYTIVRTGSVLRVLPVERAAQTSRETYVGDDPNAITPGERYMTAIVPLKTLDANQAADQLSPFLSPGGATGAGAGFTTDGTTNTLFITDTASNIRRMLGILREMERRNAAGIGTIPVKYVDANDMAQMVSEFLASTATTTTGMPGVPTPPFNVGLMPGRGQQGRTAQTQRRQSTGAGGATVLVDARTNSLILMTSPERLEQARDLVAMLDKPVEYASTIAVIPLRHSRADEIATRLGNSFGGTTGAAAGQTTTQRGTSAAATGRTTGVGSRTSTRTGRAFLQSNDPNTEPTLDYLIDRGDGTVTLAQAQGQSQGTAGTAVGRGQDGRIVPLIEGRDIVVIPDAATNSLIINASPEKIELVRQLVDRLDVNPPQVLIKAIIAEVNLSKENQLGFEYEFLRNNLFSRQGVSSTLTQDLGIAASSSTAGLTWSVLRAEDFSALMRAFASDSTGRILSTPSIFTTSGKGAKATVATTVYYPSSTTQATSTTVATTNYQSEDVGVILDVVPYVGEDGSVTMDVSQSADDLLRFQSAGADVQLPIIARRTAEASVTVQDGQTVILGGLMSERRSSTVTGVPILKDIPLIGSLFRSRTGTREKSELLVFLTPYVVRNAAEAQMVTEQERKTAPELDHLLSSPRLQTRTPAPAPEPEGPAQEP